MKGFKGTKGIIIFLILIFMLIGYYFYLSNRQVASVEETVETTKIQEVLLRDLDRNYPATPKELLKYYSELTQCFYNEEYSEEELEQLAERAMELYDPELVSYQSSTYVDDLKEDIRKFKSGDIQVSSYKPSNSTDVKYFTKDGYECASLYCNYTLRVNTQLQSVEEIFVLRKDAEGHWKIYGWESADQAEDK